MHAFDVTFFALPAACPHPGVTKKQNKKHVSKKAVINLLVRSKMASKSTSNMQHLHRDPHQPLAMNILNVCGTTPGPSTFNSNLFAIT
jgi:hypothetical protein